MSREDALRQGFDPGQFELTELFVGHVFTLLKQDRRHSAPLKRGVDFMAKKLNTMVPDMNEGRQVGGLGPDDLKEVMDPLDCDVILTFIEVTGSIMFESQDGPMGSAVHLKTAINEVQERLERRTGS